MRSVISSYLWVWVFVLIGAAPAFAQTYFSIAPADRDNGVLQWAILLGVLVLLCIGAFMNAKRSHQD